MALTFDLPPPLEAQLALEASREGVPAEEVATALLHLVTALTADGQDTPFRRVVMTFFDDNDLDADRVAALCSRLVKLCLWRSSKLLGQSSQAGDAVSGAWLQGDRPQSVLSRWRDAVVHRPIEINFNFDPSVVGTHPDAAPVPRPDRERRSALGKYSHVGGGTEDHLREKHRDISLENQS